MPNPKAGTVTMDVASGGPGDQGRQDRVPGGQDRERPCAGGQGEFQAETQLAENLQAFMDTILRAKPAAAKGQYIRSATVSSTMGPGRPARHGGVSMSKAERQAEVAAITAALAGRTAYLRHRLLRPERGQDDGVPSSAAWRRGPVHGGEEHAGRAGARHPGDHGAEPAPDRTDRAGAQQRAAGRGEGADRVRQGDTRSRASRPGWSTARR